MVKVFNTGEISKNGSWNIDNVEGEILKVVAFNEVVKPNVKLRLRSVDGETLCDDYLIEEATRFYPRNTINISQEQMHVENYSVLGKLFIYVEGLGDGEKIDNIAIYYK